MGHSMREFIWPLGDQVGSIIFSKLRGVRYSVDPSENCSLMLMFVLRLFYADLFRYLPQITNVAKMFSMLKNDDKRFQVCYYQVGYPRILIRWHFIDHFQVGIGTQLKLVGFRLKMQGLIGVQSACEPTRYENVCTIISTHFILDRRSAACTNR